MKDTTVDTIWAHYSALLQKLPKSLADQTLFTGGTAAYLFGSDRPFSDDYDVMVPKSAMPVLKKYLNLDFAYNKHKPIFHSLVAHFQEGSSTYDFIVESIVEPYPLKHEFPFFLTDEIIQRREKVSMGKYSFLCIPKELLVLIKLLAGRGKELGKYDLYDVHCILEQNDDFDLLFFTQLMARFCQPFEKSIPLFFEHALHIQEVLHNTRIEKMLSVLERLQ